MLGDFAPYAPDAGHFVAQNDLLSGTLGSPDKHYFAAMLTGCASPAARTALEALQDECGDATAAPAATCETLALIAGDPLDAATRNDTAEVLTSTTGGQGEAAGKRTKPREASRASDRRSTRP